MWYTGYVQAIKRELRDGYGFEPLPGSTDEDPLLSIPDGEYPMKVEDAIDRVRVKDGVIHCGNFEEESQ